MLEHYRVKNDFLRVNAGLETTPFSCINSPLQMLSQFTDFNNLKLPFLISGRLVTSGVYKENGYGQVALPPETLKSSMEKWVGISIYSSHSIFEKVMKGEDVSINEVLGKITRVEWNEEEQGIDFYAEIYDKQIAYKMAYGVVKFISVGFGRDIVSDKNKLVYMNLEPKEASLVFNPRDKQAEFKPVEM